MSTFLTIIKILPWVLTLVGGGVAAFYRFRIKWLDKKFDEHSKIIKNLKQIIIDQNDEIEKREKIINEMLTIQKKYEKKKGSITGARSATKIMEDLHGVSSSSKE